MSGALLLGLVLLVVAAGLLVAGAELFVENLAGAASRLGLSVVAVAVLLAGAEPEEAVTSVLASAAGRPAFAVGDALGANVTVLTLALGLAALAGPLPLGRQVRRYALMASAGGALAVALLADNALTRPEGLVLLLGYAVLVAVVWRVERAAPRLGELAELDDDELGGDDGGHDDADGGRVTTRARRPAGAALARAVAGLAVMTLGGVAAVAGAQRVVSGSGLDDTAVGLTLLGLATSAEMLALVAAARRHAVAEVAVAGAVGAAAYNATVTLGLAPVVSPLRVEGFGAAAVLAAGLPLVVVALGHSGALGRGAGAVLVTGYVVATAMFLTAG